MISKEGVIYGWGNNISGQLGVTVKKVRDRSSPYDREVHPPCSVNTPGETSEWMNSDKRHTQGLAPKTPWTEVFFSFFSPFFFFFFN